MGFGFLVGVFGGLLLSHGALATIHYRGMLKIAEEEFSGPPMNVVVELLLGLVLCMWAGLAVPSKFHSVLPDSDENRVFVPANGKSKVHLNLNACKALGLVEKMAYSSTVWNQHDRVW
ncbi:membrane magnesium transporter-like isoform X1 [Typha angustifolia]|uniref:membrane magnesium transporter-like isoform X1 n=1 Tax=Typha angustifolia TaxID=59011 RepID=UPI003C2DC104